MKIDNKTIAAITCTFLLQALAVQATNQLHMAVKQDDQHAVKKHIDNGENVNSTGQHGSRPLHFATANCSIPIIKMLIDAGATIDATDQHGNEALHIAVAKKQPEVVEALLRSGASGTTVNATPEIPLEIALDNRDKNTIKMLLKYGTKLTDPLRGTIFRTFRDPFYQECADLAKSYSDAIDAFRQHLLTSGLSQDIINSIIVPQIR